MLTKSNETMNAAHLDTADERIEYHHLGHGRDEIHLHQAAGYEQAGRAHGGARWRRAEELLPHLVEGAEVVQVGVEDLCLDDVVQGRAGGLERASEILEHVAGLPLDVRAIEGKGGVHAGCGGHAGGVVAGDL